VTIGEWLAARTPAPPEPLTQRLKSVLSDAYELDAGQCAPACLSAAERLVEGLIRGNCTSRESALDLLTADALVTYAFEAASADPATLSTAARSAMSRIAALAVLEPVRVMG
jgi:hypothetical protein